MASPVVDSEAITDRRSASRELLLVITEPMWLHGARIKRPLSGRMKKSAVMAASRRTARLSDGLDLPMLISA